MKFSIVTISFNQVDFLNRTLHSVFGQGDVELEYIVVDPGSTDGSRDILLENQHLIDHLILEPDDGPADGLNKGFCKATGDIFGYLNSDDTLEPGALRQVAAYFEMNPDIDVVSGNAWLTDSSDKRLRRIWSEPFNPQAFAFGASTIVQPSTFIRSRAFERSGGFNLLNRSNWDGELLVDLYLSGARFALLNKYLSNYRLHSVSITNSGSLDDKIRLHQSRMFERIMGRRRVRSDVFKYFYYKIAKHLRNPNALLERIFRGPVYRRGV